MMRMLLTTLLVATAMPAQAGSCDRACLLRLADQTVTAIAAKNYRALPWAKKVRFTENGVPLNIGDGIWGSTGTATPRKAIAVADPETGEAVWMGTVYDHDLPAIGALRIKAPDGRIEEVELVSARKFSPGPMGDAAGFAVNPRISATIAPPARNSRERLQSIADGYLSTIQQNDGTLFARFTADCDRRENGVSLTSGDFHLAKIQSGCEAQFRKGLYQAFQRVRDIRFPVIDAERGIVVAISSRDMPMRLRTFTDTDGTVHKPAANYPATRLVVELLRIENGAIANGEAVSVHQPYRMESSWVSEVER